jgi:3-hydroxyisobutyrate dehydrogenase-like beta-hydroxyacid dehydrogenase
MAQARSRPSAAQEDSHMTIRVGYIGLGDMGGAMASNLAPKGFDVLVYDLDSGKMEELTAAGAKPASSCRQVGEHAELLSVCVPGDPHVEAVLLGENGALAGMAAGSLVAIHSTVQPATVERMAEAARARGVELIDVCVTGGRAVAEKGELTLLIGGEAAAAEKARPVLEAYGTTLLHAGPLGSGAKLKLAVNLLTYVNWAAAAESYRLAKASGLDPEILLQAVISNGQLSEMQQRFVASQKLPDDAAASEGYQGYVRIQMYNAEKDLDHALELGRSCGISLPAAGVVSQDMARIYRVNDEKRR